MDPTLSAALAFSELDKESLKDCISWRDFVVERNMKNLASLGWSWHRLSPAFLLMELQGLIPFSNLSPQARLMASQTIGRKVPVKLSEQYRLNLQFLQFDL